MAWPSRGVAGLVTRSTAIGMLCRGYNGLASFLFSSMFIMSPKKHVVALFSAIALAACADHGTTNSVPPVSTTVTPQFETRSEVPTGISSHADFVVADFNGDQQLDMLVASLTGEVQVLLGSNGTFTNGQQLMVGGAPVWLASGDMDHDGDLDVMVVRADVGLATALNNDGLANFSIGYSVPVGSDALSIVLADANNDGDMDVVMACQNPPAVELYMGNGTGQFVPGTILRMPGGGRPFALAVGDVTGDLVPDLVTADIDGDRVLIYPGGGTSLLDFAEQPTELHIAGGPCACSIGDLNSDGVPDLAVSAFFNSQLVVVTQYAHQPGEATYTATTVQLDGAPALSVIADVTGDGRNDIVTCLATRATMAVVAQRVDGSLAAPFQLDATGFPLRAAVGDVNRDGRMDLLALSSYGDRINLWPALPDGRLAGARNYDTGLLYSNYVAAADFDGDGRSDAVVGDNFDSQVVIMQAGAQGDLQVTKTINLGAFVFNVRTMDVDRDGDMDVLVPVENGVKILRNTSGSNGQNDPISFDILPGTGANSYGLGVGPFGVAAADFDADGHLDLALVDYADGSLQIMRGTGNCNFLPPDQIFGVGGGPVDVVAADFSGDGKLDLAISREHLADILVLQNDGLGNFSVQVSLPVGAAPNYLLSADFDRDGRADLIVSNGDAGSITVLSGEEGGFLSAEYPAGRSPTALSVKDLTGDGREDILVASLEDGNYRVLVNDRNGNFPSVFQFPGSLGATSGVLGDIDGDQDLDLFIANLISNRLSVVKNISR